MAMTKEQVWRNNAETERATKNLLEGIQQAEIGAQNYNNPIDTTARIPDRRPHKVLPFESGGGATHFGFADPASAALEDAERQRIGKVSSALQGGLKDYGILGQTTGNEEADEILKRLEELKNPEIVPMDEGTLSRKHFMDTINNAVGGRGSKVIKQVLNRYGAGQEVGQNPYGRLEEPSGLSMSTVRDIYDALFQNGSGGYKNGDEFLKKVYKEDPTETSISGRRFFDSVGLLGDMYKKALLKEREGYQKGRAETKKVSTSNTTPKRIAYTLLNNSKNQPISTYSFLLKGNDKDAEVMKDFAEQFQNWIRSDKDLESQYKDIVQHAGSVSNLYDNIESSDLLQTFTRDYLSKQKPLKDSEGNSISAIDAVQKFIDGVEAEVRAIQHSEDLANLPEDMDMSFAMKEKQSDGGHEGGIDAVALRAEPRENLGPQELAYTQGLGYLNEDVLPSARARLTALNNLEGTSEGIEAEKKASDLVQEGLDKASDMGAFTPADTSSDINPDEGLDKQIENARNKYNSSKKVNPTQKFLTESRDKIAKEEEALKQHLEDIGARPKGRLQEEKDENEVAEQLTPKKKVKVVVKPSQKTSKEREQEREQEDKKKEMTMRKQEKKDREKEAMRNLWEGVMFGDF